MTFYDVFKRMKKTFRDKLSPSDKYQRDSKYKPVSVSKFDFRESSHYDPFKFTIDDVRKVNDMMMKGHGIPEDKMRFSVHLTEEEINSAYGRAIQEIQRY